MVWQDIDIAMHRREGVIHGTPIGIRRIADIMRTMLIGTHRREGIIHDIRIVRIV